MATLSVNVKRFIVQALARFESPTHVQKAVKEEFGLDITRQHVARYDPTKVAGHDLSKDLSALFHETRKHYREHVEEIPIANQAFRLASLNRLHTNAAEKNNGPLAAQLLEQAAKEIGGAYTNTRKLEGGNPKNPIAVASITASADGIAAEDVGKLYKALMG